MSDGMGREFTYLSSHATNRYFIPNWGLNSKIKQFRAQLRGVVYLDFFLYRLSMTI